MTEKLKVIKKFNATIIELLSNLEKVCETTSDLSEIKRLRHMVAIALQSSSEDILIKNSADKMIEFGELILKRDETFLKNKNNIINLYGKTLENKDAIYFAKIFEIIVKYYEHASQEQKDNYYETVIRLYKYCLKYSIYTK